jgi:ribose transport system substrate-binding protein
MKRILLFVSIALLAFLSIGGLFAQNKVALIMGGISHDVNVLWYRGAIDGLKSAKLPYVVYNAEDDRARTVSYFEDAIRQKVGAILVANVFTDSVEPIVKKAKDAGIPTFSIDAGIPSAACEITSDNQQIGRAIATEMAAKLKGKGNIVVFYSPGYKPIDIRREMLTEVLAKYPNIKILAELSYAWPGTVVDTQAKMESLLARYPEKGSIDAVWGCFDLCTVGAIQATKAAGRDEILGFGIDGDKVALQMIAGDTGYWATMLQDPFTQGRMAAIQAGMFIKGEKIQSPFNVPANLVNKNNVAKALKDIETKLK